MAMALAVSWTMIGQIAVGLCSTSKPASRMPARASSTFARSLATRCGSRIRTSIAFSALHAMVHGSAFEKSVGRPRWMSRSIALREPAM